MAICPTCGQRRRVKHPPSSFWKRVEIGPDCWTWTGGKVSKGYGSLANKLAHRWSWELNIGPIPDGKMVLHKCDNRICVNPKHLFLGTARDNILDCVQKGRWSNGK